MTTLKPLVIKKGQIQQATAESVLDYPISSTWDAGVVVQSSEALRNVIQLTNGNIMVLGNTTNKIYKSTDLGATWDAGTGVKTGAGVYALTQLSNGNIVVVGLSSNRIYTSTDNGATWDAGVLVASSAGLIGVAQLLNGNIVAIGNTTNKIYKSTDLGVTWDAGTVVASSAGLTGITVLSNGNILACGITTNKVYKSTDNGATWDAGTLISGAGIADIKQLSNGNIVVVGNSTGKVYTSTDLGVTWDVGTDVAGAVSLTGIAQLSNGNIVATGSSSHKLYTNSFVYLSPNNTLTSYASGTAYNLTNSGALLAFGTTSPSLTINARGTYIINARVNLKYNAATFALNQTVFLKLRRTNNTAGDVTNSSTTIPLRITTTLTDSAGVIMLPPIVYTTNNINDVIELWGFVSATPSAGSLQATEASILATRLF